MKTIGYAAHNETSPLEPYHFERRLLRQNDVLIEILYSGVCHSDLHTARNDWGGANYPVVPGHEIIGKVLDVGSEAKQYQIGETVAVGCLVDSCQACDQCENHEEQHCRTGITGTYNSPDRVDGEITKGGYAKHIVVREEFVMRVPKNLDITRAAPILCAGITTYSPLRHWNVGPGSRVGVIGMGGLGHMAVKLAVAMQADVTVLTRTEAKTQDALDLGVHKVLVSGNAEAMQAAMSSFDLIIDTVPVKHDLNPYVPLLDVNGTIVIVGQVGPMEEPHTFPLIFGRKRIAGSLIGGIKETQEVLDFCAKHGVLPDCEIIRMDQINEAWERMVNSDVRYRFVIDMSSLNA